jgi:hypothetical protein
MQLLPVFVVILCRPNHSIVTMQVRGGACEWVRKQLSPKQREELLSALKARFEKNMRRHKGLEWTAVATKLEADTDKLLVAQRNGENGRRTGCRRLRQEDGRISVL